ncbi:MULTISPECIES: HD domain-containing protein [Serratia]|uniref:HD domain-containing protein n=1 Tax=Serratia TaxID=613 RepID=UPI00041526F9|nr:MULTISPECIES: HD domain-containing protein [Serratia]MDQ7211987.1 HD domain-containing protein [Serratia fonticola]CAI2159746.1 Bifunctional (p)ppGpp synthase/hydrolase SpoT [Serratia fonticola]HBE9082221.1 bifunctional (p)ppGpp synthetase/guanosine-3',5'-bis(diphosphate) 3'-pyrophosphohydrolase [Serratia fonticola]HBE9092711.1 bifunctional (p)ppGpp synthetase/guanosine-3',5'-bis(diphosphate) 3'-pyrophosphohydrolase [Serratia fonticola]HBE9155061.1 bifunctional (p)ppGpp synthetase/guanosine
MTDTLAERARRYATKAHGAIDQRRKYTNAPYIVHPQAVMEIVSSVPHSEEMLAAAWLHDTVEDTPSTLADIESHFGPQVASLVAMLTNVSVGSAENRYQRKNRDRRHSASASPQAKTIKLADLIDNTRSLLQYDSHFAKTYLVEKQRLLEVLTEGDPQLWRQASHIIEQGLQALLLPPHNVPARWFDHARQRYQENEVA